MSHTCHAPGCDVPVPPKLFACKAHWFSLPKHLRDAIWRHYRPGQERDKNPSAAYVAAARAAQEYLAGVRPEPTAAAEPAPPAAARLPGL
jgi:hypothetical protein